ncbi:MAG: cytochrome d ubiquinol oxidase subunit II [Deltaproteobacteria bacterium]|nr:cytochrome d ubiquinol oxidase subunit II [Deltaproteobacteria bacterium]
MGFYQVAWFLLVGFLLTVYAVLDGFDLGLGFWYPFLARGEGDRSRLMRSIGPFWNGNEVWLITGVGALFAAFPVVYATVFSGFYLAMMFVLVALIFRSVALEFRFKEDGVPWHVFWDGAFWFGSTLAPILFGVVMGNILRGISLDTKGQFAGSFWTLLNPYSLSVGLVALMMVAFQGALYAALKTDGQLAQRARILARGAGYGYLVLVVALTLVSPMAHGHLRANFDHHPLLWTLPVATLAVIVVSLWFERRGSINWAFTASSLSIVTLMATAGAALFPRLVVNRAEWSQSLTVANASSSPLTLKTMFIMTLIGMPLVIGYTVWVYHSFRGKTSQGTY